MLAYLELIDKQLNKPSYLSTLLEILPKIGHRMNSGRKIWHSVGTMEIIKGQSNSVVAT
jgi:hypothetical protein